MFTKLVGGKNPADTKQGAVSIFDEICHVKIPFDNYEPIDVDNESFKAKVFFAHRVEGPIHDPRKNSDTGSSSSSSGSKQKPRLDGLDAMFQGKKRLWEVQVQLEFKKGPPDRDDIMFV